MHKPFRMVVIFSLACILCVGCPPLPAEPAIDFRSNKYERVMREINTTTADLVLPVSARRAEDYVLGIGKTNGIVLDTQYGAYIKRELLEKRIVSPSDIVIQFAYYKRYEKSPLWTHLIIIRENNGQTGIWIRRVAHLREALPMDNYNFDWVRAISEEYQKRGGQ